MMQTLKELCLEIISTCPMRCIHCSNDSILQEELKFKEITSVIDDFKDLGGQILEISGGEPLEHTDLLQIIKYAKMKGLEVRLYTSGLVSLDGKLVFINSNLANNLKNSGLDKIIFNIEGYKLKTHELITGQKGSYKKAIESVSVAISAKLWVGIHFVPTKLNFREVRQAIENGIAMGVSEYAILRFVPQGRGHMNREELELSHEENEELFNVLNNIKLNSNIRIGHPLNCFIGNSESSECIAGKSLCLIKPNGDIVPCPAFKQNIDYVVGNIKEKSLINIWYNSETFKKLRLLKYKNIAGCKDCTSLSICQGGCTAQRVLTWGDFYRGYDPICPKIHKNALINYEKFKSSTTMVLSPSCTAIQE